MKFKILSSSLIINQSFYLILTQLLSKLFRFASSIYVVRILSIEDFGIIAIAMVFINGLKRFDNFGVNAALISQESLSNEYKRNGNTIKFGISIVMFLIAFVFSSYWSDLYDNKNIENVIKILSFIFILNSFSFLDRVVLTKKLNFKNQLLPELIYSIGYAVWVVIFAYLGYEYLSIVYASIIAAGSRVLCYRIIQGERINFGFNLTILKDIFNFSFWVLLGSVFFWGYTSIDNIIIGKILNLETLGLYAIAYQWGNFVSENIQGVISKILLPAYSKLQNNLKKMSIAYLKVVELNCLITIPLNLGLLVTADFFVYTIIGDKWSEIIIPLQILLIYGTLRSIQSSGGSIFYALKKPKFNTLITFITLTLTTITLIPMTIEYGIIGSAISITVSFLISFIIQLLFLTKFLKIKLLEIIIKWITPILASMLMVCFIYFLKSFFSYNLYNYFILIFCGGLLYSLCIYFCYKKNILFKNYLED
tara:strand:+ start:1722 stop:3158 length:1437 start_codon:yes stop_codon:yes gene_type:complete